MPKRYIRAGAVGVNLAVVTTCRSRRSLSLDIELRNSPVRLEKSTLHLNTEPGNVSADEEINQR